MADELKRKGISGGDDVERVTPGADGHDEEPVHASKPVMRLFVIVVLLVLLVPFVGMAVAPTTVTAENKTLALWPHLHNGDELNMNYLSQAGGYFGDHFAFKEPLVTADAFIKADTTATSANSNVILGTDGWFFYLPDMGEYRGTDILDDEQAETLARNLRAAQDYANAQGADFVFTIPPDKSTVYSEHLPYYCSRKGDRSSIDVLKPYLVKYGVNYLDLFSYMEDHAHERTLYYLRDTHWNALGGYIGANLLLESVGRPAVEVAAEDIEVRCDYDGDMVKMLFPSCPLLEDDYYFKGLNDIRIDEDGQRVAADDRRWNLTEKTTTGYETQGSGTGHLLIYDDSFMNNMAAVLSTSYGTLRSCSPSNGTYDFSYVTDTPTDTVMVECVERNLKGFSRGTFIVPSHDSGIDGG